MPGQALGPGELRTRLKLLQGQGLVVAQGLWLPGQVQGPSGTQMAVGQEPHHWQAQLPGSTQGGELALGQGLLQTHHVGAASRCRGPDDDDVSTADLPDCRAGGLIPVCAV